MRKAIKKTIVTICMASMLTMPLVGCFEKEKVEVENTKDIECDVCYGYKTCTEYELTASTGIKTRTWVCKECKKSAEASAEAARNKMEPVMVLK